MASTLDVTEHGDIHERETLPPTNTSEGKKDKTRVAISPIEMRFTRVDVTVADSGEWLDIGEHSMKHEEGDLKGRLGEPRGDMLATVNSMVHVGQQEKLSFQLRVLDKGKPKLNCFLCGELHFCRDCPKREELIARIKEYEERQRLKEEPEEDSTSTKVDGSKETVEELVEPKRDHTINNTPRYSKGGGTTEATTKTRSGSGTGMHGVHPSDRDCDEVCSTWKYAMVWARGWVVSLQGRRDKRT
ncbi:hypothetical protein Acr_00g0063160 [Actinidia rufa]|uniref:Uncharacterized protein n=1 Tax=Actinidia rufa TaxID=165716 RepID=A0A7J0DPE0_9ERIC|nr:hypothetical protein Acr_00g0063160 [Actinidia rufa]